MRHAMKAGAVLLLLPLLTGCATEPPIIQVQTVLLAPPPEMMMCRDEPPVPGDVTSVEIAEYVLDLVDAGQNCRDAIASISRWVAENKGAGNDRP